MVVGLGSGTASALAIQHLGKRLKDGSLKDIVGIPSSVYPLFVTAQFFRYNQYTY